MQARLQGPRYLCCPQTQHTHTHTGWRSSASALLRSASLGCLTKAKLWLSRLLRPDCLSDTQTQTHKACMFMMNANKYKNTDPANIGKHKHKYTLTEGNGRAAVDLFNDRLQHYKKAITTTFKSIFHILITWKCSLENKICLLPFFKEL